MTPDVVVDVGNCRIKWGRCVNGRVVSTISLPPEPEAWQKQVEDWGLTPSCRWAVAAVNPDWRDALVAWLGQHGHSAFVVRAATQLPLRVQLEHPDRVGIDRLLDAVAAGRQKRPAAAAVIVDAGSAVTVDLVDPDGTFRGGAIFPGLRLMAQALHDYTALLPVVAIRQPRPPLPGLSTTTAIEAGVYWAAAGGIRSAAELLARDHPEIDFFLTGGDAALLQPALGEGVRFWPEMTLEGLRLAAETLP